MSRFLIVPALLIASTAHAHEGAGVGGLVHLHPHGMETVIVGLLLLASVAALTHYFKR